MIKAIIFSNNSPKLLDIFFQSASANNIKSFDFSVLYNSDDNNDSEYLGVFEKNGIASFIKESNFKDNLLALLNQGESELVSFFKDTNYFFKEMPEADLEQIMSDQDIFCFSMALGKNTTHCYHNDVYNILLNEEENGPHTIKWNWVKHYLDFGRPLELGAGHTFHRKEITKLFKKWSYESIQGLEASFDKLDYYPKELMSSFKNSILVDVVSKVEDPSNELKSFDFSVLDRIIIEI
jgi:hypothetical protein